MSETRTSEDLTRAADQNTRILALLKQAGPRGVTNSELWAIGAHAAHSRISDLRKRGHQITCKREKPGIWRYRLISAGSEARKRSGDYEARTRQLEAEAIPLFAGGRS